ncbi:fibronectin type III domain-containing protein [Campylobacter anatolicus]|uniref:fibronectin type III domain-containing protein n=1 Tax=Campylobacter anatolicus TaxID=2829105 RepID=UPI002D21A765|nr:hypothetical protein [Campylobacter anatolicus]
MQLQRSYPKSVINLQATTNAPKKIILTWDSSISNDFSHYNIYRSKSRFLPYTYLVKTSSNSYEDLLTANGAEYLYKVTVVDKDGLESLKQDEAVLGKTLEAPVAPVFVSAHFDGNAVNLRWNIVENAKGYTLYREGGSTERVINDIQATNYTDRNVQMDTNYTYYVVAVDEYGLASNKSNQVQVQVKISVQ